MVADYLLHAGERSHNLETWHSRYLHHQVIPITDLIGKKAQEPQLRMDQVPTARVAEYSGEDADVAWRLCRLLEPQLAAGRAGEPVRRLEIPLIEVLAELEVQRHPPRHAAAEARRRGHGRAAGGHRTGDLRVAGHEFNIASLEAASQVLFDELKLPTQRKTGITGEASTDQETLEKLAAARPDNPLPRRSWNIGRSPS